MEVVEAQTNVMYKVSAKSKDLNELLSKVDDRTGPWIEVRKWLEEQVIIFMALTKLNTALFRKLKQKLKKDQNAGISSTHYNFAAKNTEIV